MSNLGKRCWVVFTVLLVLSLSALASYNQDFSIDKMPDDFTIVEGNWVVEDGRLIGESPTASVQGRVVFGPEMEDFVYSVDITYLSAVDPSRWFSIFFRSTETGAAPYHMFTIRQNATAVNGTELAFRAPNGNWDVRRKKPYEKAMKIGETFNIKVAVRGDTFFYFINDELQFAAEETGYSDSGIFGLHVNGSKVAFDNIKIEPFDKAKYAKYENEIE